MASSSWLWSVTGLWLAALAVLILVVRPAIARLASAAADAARGEASEGFDALLARWRLGNVVMSVLYLALLVLMVFRWR